MTDAGFCVMIEAILRCEGGNFMSEGRSPTRGFVTVATGRLKYYRMAHALLLSYRLASENPLPFAILTDRKNRYTDAFDDVVLLEDAHHSYMDKLELLTYAPYDENLFIDSDCLAFGDLNRLWSCFDSASDFSAFGAVLPMDATDGWFTREGAGKYGDQLDHLVYFHGGIYFIRRGEKCGEIRRMAQDIAEHYRDFRFRMFKNPADEPILALAMTVCGCLPVPRVTWNITLYNFTIYDEMDFFRRRLLYRRKGAPAGVSPAECLIVHFGSGQFDCPDYLRESRKVRFEHRWGRAWNPLEEKLNRALCQVMYVLIHSARLVLRPIKNWLKRRRKRGK